jgi:hypothetical protein
MDEVAGHWPAKAPTFCSGVQGSGSDQSKKPLHPERTPHITLAAALEESYGTIFGRPCTFDG